MTRMHCTRVSAYFRKYQKHGRKSPHPGFASCPSPADAKVGKIAPRPGSSHIAGTAGVHARSTSQV